MMMRVKFDESSDIVGGLHVKIKFASLMYSVGDVM